MLESKRCERQYLAEIHPSNRNFSPLRAALTLSQAADPQRLPSAVLTALLRHLPELDARLGGLGKPYQKLEALSDTFFGRLGFAAATSGESSLAVIELHRVTAARRGRPLSLGLLYYELGRRLALPLRPLGLPGGVVFASHWLPRGRVIDAASGEITLLTDARHSVELRASGETVSLRPENLRALSPRELLERYLVAMRGAALAEGDSEGALRAAHWRVKLMPESVRARWDRGLLLYRLNRHEEAERDLRVLRRLQRRRQGGRAGHRRARAEVNHLLATLSRGQRAG